MPSSPDQQFQKHRSEINSFPGKPVIQFAPVILVFFPSHNSSLLEPLKPVCQDIGCYAFARSFKFFEGSISADHQVADDQQRPPVSKDFESDADGAAGAPFCV